MYVSKKQENISVYISLKVRLKETRKYIHVSHIQSLHQRVANGLLLYGKYTGNNIGNKSSLI